MDENLFKEKFEQIFTDTSAIINENTNGIDLSIGFFDTLLKMDDKEFELIAPVFLESIEMHYEKPETRIQLAQMLAENELSYEDAIESYKKLIEELDENLDNVYGQIKIDFLKCIFTVIINAIENSALFGGKICAVPVELLENAIMPTYAHISDAAMDLYSTEEYDIAPGEQVIVKTGLKMAIPNGFALLIQPRSGISSKTKLRISNAPGLIDSGYRGEIGVIIENIEPKIKDLELNEYGMATGVLYGSSYHIGKGERIAQARLVEVPYAALAQVDKIIAFESDRGEGGFGSTGTK